MDSWTQLAENTFPSSSSSSSSLSSSSSRTRYRPQVILFKTPTPDISSDTYTAVLSSAAYEATFVPVLEERYTVDELVPIISVQAEAGYRVGKDKDNADGGARTKEADDTDQRCSWEGVVITSRRGAEGWIRAVKSHLEREAARRPSRKGKERATDGYGNDGMSEGDATAAQTVEKGRDMDAGAGKDAIEGLGGSWARVPLYTVGTASTEHLSQSGLPARFLPRLPIYPNDHHSHNPGGLSHHSDKRVRDFNHDHHNPNPSPLPSMATAASTSPKSASILVPLILETPPLDGKAYKPFLLIRGDKSLEYIPDQLHVHGREFKEVVVYSTSPKGDVRQKLEEIQDRKLNGEGVNFDGSGGEGGTRKGWLAFFSPSGVDVALSAMNEPIGAQESLQQEGHKGSTDGPARDSKELKGLGGTWSGWKIFAIGETTRRYLEEEKGLKVDAMADRPNAEGLVQAISAVAPGTNGGRAD
ncbi:hypothetical protein I316_01935 [Kwoniella heveanensis BCC8398]|uniref:Tetrapyrrole biosynthesis uroporphyrinogen III synthase domain-containing protein n=1 Tax=Kwoniella heveanensis BCC8398 TaxID=1296120 RepID=A0A1B9GYH6_9TREE|nr:hypothetical protein I316_01935 [Kwoniella heveanensis BCC8398]